MTNEEIEKELDRLSEKSKSIIMQMKSEKDMQELYDYLLEKFSEFYVKKDLVNLGVCINKFINLFVSKYIEKQEQACNNQ